MLHRIASRVLRLASDRLSPTTPRRRQLRRWLRRAQTRAAGHGGWTRADAVANARRLQRIVGSVAVAQRRWRERKPAVATYLHPVDPEATAAVRVAAAQLLEGRFTPHRSVAARHERLPPRWDEDDDGRRTEQMYRHSLRWLEPLVIVGHADGDEQAWQLATDTVVSWITGNSRPPWRSKGAWHDHAVSIRVRVLCWFFELYRRRPDAHAGILALLVASIHQHASFLADPSTYTPRSNHALEANGSLLAVCATVPELRAAGDWERLALRRLERYVVEAFTDDGFSKEQSPRYHFFILRRLAAVVTYLHAVGRAVPATIERRLQQATVVWPWLVRADGSLPRVGDTNDHALPQWRTSLIDATGAEPPPSCPSTIASPRTDGAAMLVSFAAGYAVLRGGPPDDPVAAVDDDTHVLFKCNYFRFPHFHRDGLSFVLFALGREWLIDPGFHSYEYERWERRYLCSSSAHNTVEIGASFDVHPVEFVGASRDDDGDHITVRHLPGHARHTRTLTHRPPRQVRVVDEVEVIDGTTRDVRQLFHVHPECEAGVRADGRLELRAPDGARCVITQQRGGVWRLVRGQRHPEPLGWWSPRQLVIEPITTCSYVVQTDATVVFDTTVEVHPPAR
ncbi:MAG: heparinase II/III family protein [Actinobacteria bacterium]|nr:heparinase II/III family protein [Actinomycetota bacterium]